MVEKIEDSETKFTCESCKEEVSREKQLMLDKAPSVAALHLKRFKIDGTYVEKIGKHVQFPLELDLKPYTNDNEDNDVSHGLLLSQNKDHCHFKKVTSDLNKSLNGNQDEQHGRIKLKSNYDYCLVN